MAQTPEGKVKDKIKKLFKQYNVVYDAAVATGMGTNGRPDFIACCNRQYLGVEAKTIGNKPTALQINWLRSIEKAGGIALVINEETLPLLEYVLKNLTEGRFTEARIMGKLPPDL